jgi:hypothetical protein
VEKASMKKLCPCVLTLVLMAALRAEDKVGIPVVKLNATSSARCRASRSTTETERSYTADEKEFCYKDVRKVLEQLLK